MCECKMLGARYNVTGARKIVGIHSSTMLCESKQARKENVFAECKGVRIRKRVRNSFSRDEAGTCSNYVGEVRFSNSYIHVAAKKRNLY